MGVCKCGGWARMHTGGHRKTCRLGKVGIASGFVNLDVFHEPLRGGGHAKDWLALCHGSGVYQFKHFGTMKAAKTWAMAEFRRRCGRR